MTNKERFIELLRSTKREGIEKLIDFLEKTDFFTAPASTRFHMSCEGGLLQHSLNVYDCLAGLGTTTGDVQEFQAAGMRLDSIPQRNTRWYCSRTWQTRWPQATWKPTPETRNRKTSTSERNRQRRIRKNSQRQSLSNRRAAMNTERDDREQIEAIRKMMAEKGEKKRAREIRKRLRRKRIHAFFHGKKADKH